MFAYCQASLYHRAATIYLLFLLCFRPNVNSLVCHPNLNPKQWEICDSKRRSLFDFFFDIFSPFKKYSPHHFNDCLFFLLALRPFCLPLLFSVAYPPSAAISLSLLFRLLYPYRLVPYSCPCLNTTKTILLASRRGRRLFRRFVKYLLSSVSTLQDIYSDVFCHF